MPKTAKINEISKKDSKFVLGAIDILSLLIQKDHFGTPKEKRLYERAIKVLNVN